MLGHAKAGALTLTLDNDFTRESLGYQLEFLVDHDSNIKLKDALTSKRWEKSSSEQLSFGYSSEPHWFRFRINNPTEMRQNLILQIFHSYLDQIDIFQLDQSGAVLNQETMGDHLPVDHRSLAHAHYLLPINLEIKQSTELYIRVSSSSTLSLPLTVWNRSIFIAYDHQRTVLFTVFLGMLLVISVYHLLLAAMIRDLSVVYYAMFIFSLFLLFTLREGVSALLLWPQTPLLNHYMNIFAFSAAGSSACLFVTRILTLKEAAPKFYQALSYLALIALLPSIAIFFANYSDVMRFHIGFSIILILCCCAALIKRVLDGYPPAKHLIIATVFAATGVSVGLSATLGFLPINIITQTTTFAGIALMALFYGMSISYRINLDRELRSEAQRKLTHELDELVRERTDELETVNEQLRIVSITDGLTQVFNRRHFDDCVSVEYNRAYREKNPIALLLLDIDHFKKLNDNYGHSFGDVCLQVAARIIKESVHRPSDMVARYGGEEFVVLLPETELDGAVHIAEMINKAIALQAVNNEGQTIQMTVSIGVAGEVPEQVNQHELLLKTADDLLYKAKEDGRNRVERA